MSRRAIEKSSKKPSPYIHSFSTFTRYSSIIKNFADDMKKQDIKRLVDVKYEHVKAWLEEKASRCTEKTLKVNMCALEKLFDAVNRKDISDSIRRDFVDIYSKARASGRAEPFVNPQRVIDAIDRFRDKEDVYQKKYIYERAKIWAQLQYTTGARVGDIKKIKVSGDKVIIERSKGGKTRVLDYSDAPHRLEAVKQLLKDEYFVRAFVELEDKDFRRLYETILRESARSVGEKWSGSHSFRVNYAIERYNELRSKGLSEQAADKVLTRELGHERVSMSQYYRKA